MKKSVIILGGGIAGLAAARELAGREFSVTVIEAQNRLGGRIRTVQHGGVPIEFGAEFIHGRSKPLLRAIREGGLATQIVPDKNRLFEKGHFKRIGLWEQAGEIFNRVKPRETDVTFEEFLARQADLDECARNLLRHFVEGFNAADARRISTQALMRAEHAAEQMSGSQQFRVTRGYSALVDFLAQEIERRGGVILKNTRAGQITWQPGKVEISVEHGGQTEQFVAQAAIIALPLGILKTDEVKFLPPLAKKREAIQGLEFGNVAKIIFQFRESFWGDTGFIHALDKPIPTWWNDPRGPILTGWAGGPQADELLKGSHAELEATGLKILGEIFSMRMPELRRRLVASHYWNWAVDPHIRGAYSYIPAKGLGLPQLLAAPIAETLFFAGEATVADAQTGTVFGALESGLRAAREISD